MKLATLQSRYAETIALAEEVLPQVPDSRDAAAQSETYNNSGSR